MLVDPDSAALSREQVLGQLAQAHATLEWAVRLVPTDWTHVPSRDGGWSVAMNIAHLTLYSERLPTSVLRSLLDGGDGVTGTWFGEPSPVEPAALELAAAPMSEILRRFRTATAFERELALRFSDEDWTRPSTEAWGAHGYGPPLHSPARIVAKSFQHTWEHGNAVLRMALFAPRPLQER